MKLTTTLNKIRSHCPCHDGWKTLNNYLGKDFDKDAEINLLTILDSNGVPDMLWTLRATIQDSKKVTVQLAIEFAELSLPIFKARYPLDTRPRKAIKAAIDYLNGAIEVDVLQEAAKAAAIAAEVLDYIVNKAAYGAASAATAASQAAYAAADIENVDTYIASAANTVAEAVARQLFWGEARQKQAEIIRRLLEE